jgi:hypothetical protein
LLHDPEVKAALMGVIVGTQEVVTYDLSRATISKPLPNMLSVCKFLRHHTLEFILAKDLVAKMTTNDTRATFGGYASLKHWLAKGRPQPIATPFPPSFCPSIVFNFEGAKCANWEDLRFEALQFVPVTASLPRKTAIRFQWSSKTHAAPHEQATIALKDVREAVSMAFVNLVKATAFEVPAALPLIWLNVSGRYREMDLSYEGMTMRITNNNPGCYSKPNMAEWSSLKERTIKPLEAVNARSVDDKDIISWDDVFNCLAAM